jgi:hypothetical protein
MTGDVNTNYSLFDLLAAIISGGIVSFLVASVKLGKYTQMVDDLKDDVSSIKKELRELENKLTKCETQIEERTSPMSGLTKRKSPVSLTDKGEQLLKASGADKFILENQSELIEDIRKNNPTTAYDVQEYSKEVVKSLKDSPKIVDLKNFAFKEGIELEAIFIVMGVYLRDIALPILGYTKEEVDKSDPNKTS